MILDFHNEIAEIRAALTAPKTAHPDLEIAALLATVYARGMEMEKRRMIKVIQRLAMNPGPIVAAIRRPER